MLHAGYRGVYEPTAIVYHRVGAERLDPGYFRRWLHQNGRDVARLNRVYPRRVPRLLRAPRYLWRQAAADVASTMTAAARRNRAQRFGASTRLIWFAGYLREAWFGKRQPIDAATDATRPSPFAPQAS